MRTTSLRRAVLVAIVVVAAACEGKSDVVAADPAPVVSQTQAPASTMKLQPWETFSDRFVGCAGGCGQRMTGPTEGVVVQPGAMIGQRAYCPVSGVAFEIKPVTSRRSVGDRTFYFCCESCAEYFMQNQGAILAARGLT